MKENLLHFWQKSNREVLLGILLFLLATGSFALGRLSVSSSSTKQKIYTTNMPSVTNNAEKQAKTANSGIKSDEGGGAVVASKNGSKYHDPWCPGANKISEKNKITFESEALALAAGFTRASNCPK